ncbi:HNH endonuclease [uncultured Cellulomonas sp.]|uniref:HNH endonuclease n=1 Tax=uncultured Cellulomonas sp. TaxID=189682 RepID=UPI00260C16D6|nr:HNH endonuclease signature motif containing protein [uncultured Cellulomonas sp.]
MSPSRRAVERSGVAPSAAASTSRPRADRLRAAVENQDGRCFWCGRRFSPLVPPTTDHVVPRVKGGPSWRENEVAACRRCNGERGHQGPVEWLEECLRRGWPADVGALAVTLARLETAIVERGGQRRARPYLDGQRRRLEHLGR